MYLGSMNNNFRDRYNNYSTVDLLKITMSPESYQSAAVLEAEEILKNRLITQEDIDKAEESFSKDEIVTPKQGMLINIFKGNKQENWLTAILAIAVFEYLHLIYSDIKLSESVYPIRMITLFSYIDLLYWPFVFYMFYKRMRWGWILLFGIKLFTIVPSLLFYYKEYLPIDGVNLFSYLLLTILLDISILIFLWQPDISRIFKVNKRIKMLTVSSIVLMLVLLTYLSRQ